MLEVNHTKQKVIFLRSGLSDSGSSLQISCNNEQELQDTQQLACSTLQQQSATAEQLDTSTFQSPKQCSDIDHAPKQDSSQKLDDSMLQIIDKSQKQLEEQLQPYNDEVEQTIRHFHTNKYDAFDTFKSIISSQVLRESKRKTPQVQFFLSASESESQIFVEQKQDRFIEQEQQLIEPVELKPKKPVKPTRHSTTHQLRKSIRQLQQTYQNELILFRQLVKTELDAQKLAFVHRKSKLDVFTFLNTLSLANNWYIMNQMNSGKVLFDKEKLLGIMSQCTDIQMMIQRTQEPVFVLFAMTAEISQ
ncbi:Hypothetical_protein [Hexamita inflata]|uniref:Hypothetical_protein n=1 Tax=Hexamita inflata TaxID=28002 RepID=A0AA86Q495_9EUKA|nr:Hypothetical protein HINF_LOCUS39426 [Hexamita inflata]